MCRNSVVQRTMSRQPVDGSAQDVAQARPNEMLHTAVKKRAIYEMKLVRKLIGRILFQEGRSIVSNLNKIAIGTELPEQLDKDRVCQVPPNDTKERARL